MAMPPVVVIDTITVPDNDFWYVYRVMKWGVMAKCRRTAS